MIRERLVELSSKVTGSLSRWQPSETAILIVVGVIVGLAGGAGVWIFKLLIEIFHQVFFTQLYGQLKALGNWTIFLIPVVGGLVVGLIVHYFVRHERHHGVAGIMEAAALAGGRLRYQRIPAKAGAAAVSIGCGASVGPEDPSVQIGANIGSLFGQKLRLSDERVRSLVAAGAASGISAAFNAPIAGVFFSLEIILGEISGNSFGVVVIASVISAVFTQAVSGPEPAFHVPTYAMQSPWELPLYLGLGLLAGPVSAAYIRLLYLIQDSFNQLDLPGWVKPALAGLVVGLVGIFLPQIFGVGYDVIGEILNGQIVSFWLLIALLIAKLILTPVSIGGGFQGGVFAPSLFIGSALGAAYAVLLSTLIPGANLSSGAFGMVGMAAVLAGAVHAPLTAVILLFEMTNDYRIILPVMLGVVASMLISQRMIRDSVYTLGLARKGIRLERGRNVEILETITVGEVMRDPPFTIQENDSITEVTDLFIQTGHHGLPVVGRDGTLVGILTTQDLSKAQEQGLTSEPVSQITTRELLQAYPEETIGSALRKMGSRDIGRMPVVEKSNPQHLIGWLRRSDLLRAYDLALTRLAERRYRAHQVRLDSYTAENVRVLEIPIERGAACDGKRVRELDWPANSLLASLKVGRRVIIPHGETVLRAGNTLVVVLEGEGEDRVRDLCSFPAEDKEGSR